jgi:hypothetical protein
MHSNPQTFCPNIKVIIIMTGTQHGQCCVPPWMPQGAINTPKIIPNIPFHCKLPEYTIIIKYYNEFIRTLTPSNWHIVHHLKSLTSHRQMEQRVTRVDWHCRHWSGQWRLDVYCAEWTHQQYEGYRHALWLYWVCFIQNCCWGRMYHWISACTTEEISNELLFVFFFKYMQ